MKKKLGLLGLLLLSLCLLATTPCWGTTYNIQAAHDAYVNSVHPDDNSGSSPSLWVQYGSSATIRSYLMFDLSDISAGEMITGATLHLYINPYASNIPGNVDLHHVVNDEWTENSITWNSPPGYDLAVLADVTATTSGAVSWDLMEKGNWIPDTDGAVSLMLKFNPEDVSRAYYYFSQEYGWPDQRPCLEVSTSPVPLPGALWLLGSGLLGMVWRRLRKS